MADLLTSFYGNFPEKKPVKLATKNPRNCFRKIDFLKFSQNLMLTSLPSGILCNFSFGTFPLGAIWA